MPLMDEAGADDEYFGDLVSRRNEPKSNDRGVATIDGEAQTTDGGLLITVTQEQLAAMIESEVTSAVESTFQKFVKSLRTVLGDMGRRLEAAVDAHSELRSVVDGIRESMADQADNTTTRFGALDAAMRDVEKVLQSMRDRAELAEAKQLLGSYDDDKGASRRPPVTPAAALASSSPSSSTAQLAGPGSPTPSVHTSAAPPAAATSPSAPAAATSASEPSATAPPALAQAALGAPAGVPAAPAAPGTTAAPAAAATAPDPALAAPLAAPAAPPPLSQQHAAYAAQAPAQALPTPAPPRASLGPPALVPGQPPVAPGPPPGGFANPAPVQYQQPAAAQQMRPPAHAAPHPHAPTTRPYQPPPAQHPAQHQPPPAQHWDGAAVASMPGYPQQPPLRAHPHAAVPGPAGYARAGAPGAGLPPQQQQQLRPQQHAGGGLAHGGASGGGGRPDGAKTSTRAMPLDQVVSDICAMGFERRHVTRLVDQMQRRGDAIDLNVIIDKLTRGDY